jgi:hypothetical protein
MPYNPVKFNPGREEALMQGSESPAAGTGSGRRRQQLEPRLLHAGEPQA